MEFSAELERFVHASGLVGADQPFTPEALTGGVSSDIWKVSAGERVFVIKRALSRLKVAREWLAPLDRNANEVRWIKVASRIVPEAVPNILADDPDAGIFAMDFLDPELYPVWKARLRDGHADPDFAARVGHVLGKIHGGTARRAEIARDFDNDATFDALRLDPYLRSTGLAYPELTARFDQLISTCLGNKLALVHGDVSPKNILVGPSGPVILDAECAWAGDPSFDLAFCLNHLLLKCLWTPSSTEGFLACFDALSGAYLGHVDWESLSALEARAAQLLPGLLLARIDGKSPVEYITREEDKAKVRTIAIDLLRQGDAVTTLAQVRDRFRRGLLA